MKKILVMILAVCLLVPIASAEDIDISGLSFDQLVALKERINLALFESDEWQEVTVPQGVWKVGKDIPAGKWLIKAVQSANGSTYVQYGTALDDNKIEIPYKYLREYFWVYSESFKYLETNDLTEYAITLTDGDYVVISPAYGPAVFMPYTAEPSFTFK